MSHHKVSPKKDGEARLKRALTIAGSIAGQCNRVKVCFAFFGMFYRSDSVASEDNRKLATSSSHLAS